MEKQYIEIRKVSDLYAIDPVLIREIIEFGLINSYVQFNTECFDMEDVDLLLCITRLKNDFHLDNEALEIIINMRGEIETMQNEISELRQKLNSYEQILDHKLFIFPGKEGLIRETDPED